MAWSGLLSNFAGGVFLVILQPFKVGDFVTAAPRSTELPGLAKAPDALAIFSFRNNGVTVSEAGVSAFPAGTAFRMYAEVSGPLIGRLSFSSQQGTVFSGSTLEQIQ